MTDQNKTHPYTDEERGHSKVPDTWMTNHGQEPNFGGAMAYETDSRIGS